jgi:hypothetical protein
VVFSLPVARLKFSALALAGINYVLLFHAAFCPEVFNATRWVISGGKLRGVLGKTRGVGEWKRRGLLGGGFFVARSVGGTPKWPITWTNRLALSSLRRIFLLRLFQSLLFSLSLFVPFVWFVVSFSVCPQGKAAYIKLMDWWYI